MLFSYIVTALIFSMIQLFSSKKRRMLNLPNNLVTLFLPFIGYPYYAYLKKEKKSRKTIFSNLALVNAVLLALFFALRDIDFSGFHSEKSGTNITDFYIGMVETGANVTIAAFSVIETMFLFICGSFAVIIPLILAAIVKDPLTDSKN